GLEQAFDPAFDRIDVEAEQEAKDDPRDRSDDADAGAAHQEDAHDHAARGAHGPQHRDVAPLVLHQHDQAGDYVERRHQDDQGEDQEHDVALDLKRVEEAGVGPLPDHRVD